MESLEEINTRLADNFGRFNGQARFRVVWSSDELENRVVTHTPEGLALANPEVRLVKKYNSTFHKDAYILEMILPVGTITDLVTNLSYEPVWTFRNQHTGEALPPFYGACKLVAETIMNNIEKASSGTVKYKDPLGDPEEAKEVQLQNIINLERELYGNETAIGDALKRDEAVGYGPRNRSIS